MEFMKDGVTKPDIILGLIISLGSSECISEKIPIDFKGSKIFYLKLMMQSSPFSEQRSI